MPDKDPGFYVDINANTDTDTGNARKIKGWVNELVVIEHHILMLRDHGLLHENSVDLLETALQGLKETKRDLTEAGRIEAFKELS